jgi:hypothetical protein
MGSTDATARTANEAPIAIDPYALFEALTGRKVDRRSMSTNTLNDDFEEVAYDDDDSGPIDQLPEPDLEPEDVHIGVINPFALVEAIIGQQLDVNSPLTASIISNVLQTDYEELFDLKHNSALFAGLQLNQDDRMAEPLSEKDIKILKENDLVTPNFSKVKKIQDLERFGLKNLGETRVTMAKMQNGKLRLVLDAEGIGKKLTNSSVTMTLNELVLPFRRGKETWSPPNGSWEDAYEVSRENLNQRMNTGRNRNTQRLGQQMTPFNGETSFDDPMQGASPNSWFVAALFSIFWADPSLIDRAIQAGGVSRNEKRENKRVLSVKFHDKGGRNNAGTTVINVDYEIPTSNSTMQPMYCRSNNGRSIWPALYEKAFARWISGGSSSHPDITQIHNGDPVKAMAQINGKKPLYYFTSKHSASELLGLVRFSSVNNQTISPMVAYTHATGRVYRGSNLVANHAYSVLGWASHGDSQYLILRNPFGVTEATGLTSYPGVVDNVEPEFWPPANFLDRGGVIALEASAFKEYFACLGNAR